MQQRFVPVNISLVFLLHPFFLPPACAGQTFSNRHTATYKRHWCHLFTVFDTVTVWSHNKPRWRSSLQVNPITISMTHLCLNLRANELWKPLRNLEAMPVCCGIEYQHSKLTSVKCSNFTMFQLHTTRKHLILSHASLWAGFSFLCYKGKSR